MTSVASLIPVYVQVACWSIALRPRRVRKTTSGGPRSYADHIAYQRKYQASRRTFGVRVGNGQVAIYYDRAKANRVRRGLRQLAAWGVAVTLGHADMVAAGVPVADILSHRIAA